MKEFFSGGRKFHLTLLVITLAFLCNLLNRPVDAATAGLIAGALGFYAGANVWQKKVQQNGGGDPQC